MGTRADLDAVQKRKISWYFQESKPDRPARRYTDRAKIAPYSSLLSEVFDRPGQAAHYHILDC
jgi:hypothetical protein